MTLATSPLEPDLLDELALIADPWTATRKPFAEKFRDACEASAATNDGLVNPNVVRARLLDEPDYNPRQLSALWSSPYLAKTDIAVPITGEGSKHNQNKSVFLRRWVG